MEFRLPHSTVREGARFNEVCGQCLGKSLGNDNSYSTIQIVSHDIAQSINKARSVSVPFINPWNLNHIEHKRHRTCY